MLPTRSLFVVVLALAGSLMACSGAGDEEVSADEGALIPAKAFSADCAVKQPKDDGTVSITHVKGRFVVNAGAISAADAELIHVINGEGKDTTVTLKTGRVIDAEKDIFEVQARYGIFSVDVHYDGSLKEKNVTITASLKGTSSYDGSCTFVDEAGGNASGKVR